MQVNQQQSAILIIAVNNPILLTEMLVLTLLLTVNIYVNTYIKIDTPTSEISIVNVNVKAVFLN